MHQEQSLRKELLLLLACVFCLASLLVWIRALTVKSSYEFVRQEKTFRQIEQDNQVLRVRWLKLTSPRKLESLATQLGLQPAKVGQKVKLRTPSAERNSF